MAIGMLVLRPVTLLLYLMHRRKVPRLGTST
jgi:hypothetical protein